MGIILCDMAQEIERVGTEGEDYFVIQKRGREIIVPIRKEGDEYHPDAQIRAYQLVHEGRIGGRRPGAGRPEGRKRRISAAVVEEAQERLQPKIIRVLERGLTKSAGIRQNLQTVKLITDMEHHEASLALKEEEVDLSKQDRGELIGTLVALLEDPQTEAALEDIIEGSAVEVEEADPNGTQSTHEGPGDGDVHVGRGDGGSTAGSSREPGKAKPARKSRTAGTSAGKAKKDGAVAREAGSDGRGSSASDRGKRRNPWSEAAKGGSGD